MDVLLLVNLRIEYNDFKVKGHGPETQDEWLTRMSTKYDLTKQQVWEIVGEWFEDDTN